MNITGVSVLISLVTLLNLGLGFFTLKKGPKKKTNLVFFLICISLTIWTASHAIALTVTNNGLALFWTRMIMVGAVFLPGIFSWFANVFEDDAYKLSWPLMMSHLVAVSFFLANLFSPAMIREAHITPSGIDWKGGWIFYLYFSYYTLFMGYGIFIFIKKHKTAQGLFRGQLAYVLFGASTSIALGLLVSIFLPIVGITQLNKYGPAGTILMIGSFSYAIVRYRLMDLRVFLRETARYFLSAGSLSFVVALIVVVAAGDLRLGFLVFLLALALPIGQRRLNKWFVAELSRRGIIDSKRAERIKTIADRIQGVGPNIAHLGETVTDLIMDLMQTTTSASFYVINTEQNCFELAARVGSNKNEPTSIPTTDPLITYLDFDPKILVITEGARSFHGGDYDGIRASFEGLQSELCAPLIVLDRVVALIFLGKKSDGRTYFSNEIDDIEKLAKESSIALKHGLTMANYSSEIKRWAHSLNQTLKPLSQGFEVLVNNDPSIKEDPIRSAVYDRMKRPLKKLNDFLKFLAQGARIMGDTLRNQYQTGPINLQEIIRKSIKDFKDVIDNKSVKVEAILQSEGAEVLGHRGDIESVFDGLLSNSLRYVSNDGNIKIDGKVENDKYRIVYENDGPPIKSEDLDRIFIEGVQLEGNAPGMMGFGLANSKRIMELHHGRIWAENNRNNIGVHFILELPIRNALKI